MSRVQVHSRALSIADIQPTRIWLTETAVNTTNSMVYSVCLINAHSPVLVTLLLWTLLKRGSWFLADLTTLILYVRKESQPNISERYSVVI